MNPIVYAIPVFMLTILAEAWLARRRGLRVYDIPDAITSLHHGVISQISGAFAKVLTLGIYVAIYENARIVEWPADSLWFGFLALVFYDFCYYWNHRMGHEVNVLWASHVVHHSSEYYNLSTALRQTSTGNLFGWLFYVPMALAGIPPSVFIIVAVIDLLYQYWVHTELVGSLGWFDRVFCSPSNHRVHHGQNDYCIDKNYGGILILWDRLFGTFEPERLGPDAEPIRFGIRKPLQSYNPLWGNLHYYADMVQLMKDTPGVLAKIGVVFAPPGGWGQPLPHFDPAGFHRYAPPTPANLRRYAGIQYALTVPAISHFLASFNQMGTALAAAYALVIFISAMSLGALLQHPGPARRLWLRLEQCRVTALGLCFALLPDWFGYTASQPLRLALLAGLLGCAAWLNLHARELSTDAGHASDGASSPVSARQ